MANKIESEFYPTSQYFLCVRQLFNFPTEVFSLGREYYNINFYYNIDF